MSKIGTLLKEEMVRLARKEARGEVRAVKRASAQYRREIAQLKRQMRTLTSKLAQQEKQMAKLATAAPVPEPEEPLRFSAKGLRAQRKRLGLAAADYAKLVGVTPLSIYNWERGVVRPKQDWLRVLASLRSLSKREAQARLEQSAVKSSTRRRRRR